MRVILLGLASGLALSCHPGSGQPAGSEELCGATDPVRLLEFGPDEMVSSMSGVRSIEDRLYFRVGKKNDLGFTGPPLDDRSAVYSTGPCGEDLILVAEEMSWVFAHGRWPGEIFGCSRTGGGDLYVLDPTGASPPALLLREGCGGGFTDHGLVHVEWKVVSSAEADERLVFYPFKEGSAPELEGKLVLLESMDPLVGGTQVLGDEVFAIDRDYNLIRASLPDGSITVEQGAVRKFEVSPDGRYLVWQDLEAPGDVDAMEGDIMLRDRESGAEMHVAHTRLRSRGVFRDDYAKISFGPDAGERFVWLPSFDVSDVPPGSNTVRRIEDGRFLMSPNYLPTGPWSLRDLVTGQESLLTDMTGTAAGSAEFFLDIVAGAAGSSDDGELWRYHYDGSEPALLAHRARADFLRHLSDGRLVTIVDVDNQGLGELVLVDPATLAETVLDTRVAARSIGAPQLFDGDTIVYAVSDGERSGVWAIRPAGS